MTREYGTEQGFFFIIFKDSGTKDGNGAAESRFMINKCFRMTERQTPNQDYVR